MILVFDLGATHTRLSLSDKGELGDVVRMDTDTSKRGLARFLGAVQELGAFGKVKAVVGGMPGQLEGPEGRLVLAPNLPDWLGLPVGAHLKEMFNCPVNVLNDVVLGGLGEAHYGAGETKGVMAYFTISTGVNAVRIVDGRVDPTIDRFEVGKMIIGEHDGHVESLESLTGGAALEKREGAPPSELRDDAKVWRAEEHSLAVGLYDTLLAWSPELVVFGGSMMRDIDLRVVKRELDRLPNVLSKDPQLRRAKLKDLAGLYGAMAWWGSPKK